MDRAVALVAVPGGRGVVGEDVEAAPSADGGVDGAGGVGRVGNIRRDEQRGTPGGGDLGDSGAAAGLVQVGDEHTRALAGKEAGGGPADAGGGSGDEGDAVGEEHGE